MLTGMITSKRKALVVLGLLGAGLGSAACSPIYPVYTSTEPRIWVVKGQDQVYRCADMATGEDKAPQPICIEAERVGKD